MDQKEEEAAAETEKDLVKKSSNMKEKQELDKQKVFGTQSQCAHGHMTYVAVATSCM